MTLSTAVEDVSNAKLTDPVVDKLPVICKSFVVAKNEPVGLNIPLPPDPVSTVILKVSPSPFSNVITFPAIEAVTILSGQLNEELVLVPGVATIGGPKSRDAGVTSILNNFFSCST